ncbi:hypothetical protein Tco_0344657 [Tanacetum coccineum]
MHPNGCRQPQQAAALSWLLRCKETWPQQPLLGLLRRTHCPRVATFKDLRSISRIKSSSRQEVTILNLVFRCSEICLNDLDFATLHIDGQSTDVDAPPDIIDVDKDDDIIDDEDALPHDLADSDD